jgi:hypothetical protein
MNGKRSLGRRRFGAVPVLVLFLTLLLLACGGGGGSNDNHPSGTTDPSTPDPQDDGTSSSNTSTDERDILLGSMTASLAALAEESQRGSVLAKLAAAHHVAGGSGAGIGFDQIGAVSDGDNDNCATVDYRGDTLVISFDGSAACDGLEGSLEITPADGNDPEQDVIVSDIAIIDLSLGDGCLINGEQRLYATLNGNAFSAQISYDLDVCGQRQAGQVAITGTTADPDQWVFQLEARDYTIDDGVDVQVEVDWQLDEGNLSGDGEIRYDGAEFTFLADHLVMDPGCGLPTGGSLTLFDADGTELASADFSHTSCEIPVATVSIDGDLEEWILMDRPRG